MVRLIIGTILLLLLRRDGCQRPPDEITHEKAEFIEQKTELMYRYVLDSYDIAKAEGKNVLQWLFAAVMGGVGLAGTLMKGGYESIAVGALAASVWAAFSASRLIRSLKSNEISPPGNEAATLQQIRREPFPRMRWAEAIGLDARNHANRLLVAKICSAVDRARDSIVWIPAWFLLFSMGVASVRWIAKDIPFLIQCRDWIMKLPL
ncbi:MAG: hypothetical protein ACOYM3_17130 [Terrimicrobiaceae bacterium]